jgi:hypothetical protein
MKQSMGQGNVGRWMAGVCCLLMVLCGVRSAIAQQSAVAKPAAASTVAASAALPTVSTYEPAPFSALMPGVVAAHPAAKPAGEEQEESQKPGKPGGEGIKVHGHWVMEVKNPDGTVAERREFNNSLVTLDGDSISGDQLLAGLLSGNLVAGAPTIGFVSGDPIGNGYRVTDICMYPNAPTSATNEPFTCNTPSVSPTAQVTFSPVVAWVLSTNFTVPAGVTTINSVLSLVPTCYNSTASFVSPDWYHGYHFVGTSSGQGSTVPSASCQSAMTAPQTSFLVSLTFTTITSGIPAVATPLSVTAGQIITTTVTISFS